jgi:hypothetical protein
VKGRQNKEETYNKQPKKEKQRLTKWSEEETKQRQKLCKRERE